MIDKIILFFRTRLILHIAGAIAVCEFTLTLLSQWVKYPDAIFYSSLTALLVVIISEIRDILKWHQSWIKEWYDFAGWIFGGCIFIALELLKKSCN